MVAKINKTTVLKFSFLKERKSISLQVEGFKSFLFPLRQLNFFEKRFKFDRIISPKDRNIVQFFERLFIDIPKFYSWWGNSAAEISKQDGVAEFIFRNEDEWQKPWEILLSKLEFIDISRVNLVRTSTEKKHHIAKFSEDKLRILIIIGDNGSQIDKLIHPERDAKLVQEVWRNLPSIIKSSIEEPLIVENCSIEELPDYLDKFKPHLFWFSGHGITKNQPQVLFPGNKWVSASTLANIINEAKFKPFYAVFWACDSAIPSKQMSNCSAPELITQLSNAGIVSVLAMQSPIGDFAAQIMAKELFIHLSNGLPLHKAVSRARAIMFYNENELLGKANWAIPVIWSNGDYPSRLNWNHKHSKEINLLSTTLNLLRSSYKGNLYGRNTLFIEDKNLNFSIDSELFMNHPKIWIKSSVNDDSFIYIFLNQFIKQIDFNVSNTIVIDLKSFYQITNSNKNTRTDLNIDSILKDWASRFFQSFAFEAENLNTFIEYRLLFEMQGGYIKYIWERICNLENIILIVLFPPNENHIDPQFSWFWEYLNNSNNMCTVIFSDDFMENINLTNWQVENFSRKSDKTEYSKHYQLESKLIEVLTFLERPIERRDIESCNLINDINFLQADLSQEIITYTKSGYLLNVGVKDWLISNLKPEAKERIILDCIEVLIKMRFPDWRIDVTLEEEIFKLYSILKKERVFLQQGQALIKYYYKAVNPYRITLIVDRLGRLALHLEDEYKIYISWAYMQLYKLQEVYFWISKANPIFDSQKTLKNSILAEYYKSLGGEENLQTTLKILNENVKIYEERKNNDSLLFNEKDEKDLRIFYHDRARFYQHVLHEYDSAVSIYKELIQNWKLDIESTEFVSIARRNLAECYRSKSSIIGQEVCFLEKAKNQISNAIQLLESRKLFHISIFAECYYEKAKIHESFRNYYNQKGQMNEKEQATNDQKESLLLCIEYADKQNHLMIKYIAQTAFFWAFESFNFETWFKLNNNLKVSNHGWAIRTYFNSSIKAAQYLVTIEPENSIKILTESLTVYRKYSYLESGNSDKTRIAKIFSGIVYLNKLKGKQTNHWDEFLSIKWAKEWLIKSHFSTKSFEEIFKS